MPYTNREFKNLIYGQLAGVGKALASPVRLEILDLLCQGPKSVEVLGRLIEQSTANASQHLKVLKQSGLVVSTRDGNHIVYTVADEGVAIFASQFMRLGEEHIADIAHITRVFLNERQQLDRIDFDQLLQKVRKGEVTLIDVRPEGEYVAGHIPSAISVPMDELERMAAYLPKDKEIVAYCRGPLCVMAIEAVNFLKEKGYQAIRMEYGVMDWQARGLPLSGGSCP